MSHLLDADPADDAVSQRGTFTNRSIPDASHYESHYLGANAIRLFSYQEQIRCVLELKPKSVLLVGKGDGLVEDILAGHAVHVTTLDVMGDLRPGVIGSVTAIPMGDARFDTVVCCQ